MTSAEDLERGMFIVINNDIYKIIRKEVIACGTHSHSKTKLYVQHILGGGEKNFTFAHQDKVEVAEIENRVGQVISKGDNKLTVMDTTSYETLDVDASSAIIDGVKEGSTVFFFTYQGGSTATKIDRE
jgi:translation elongation factor P/translation initiation factor 5A